MNDRGFTLIEATLIIVIMGIGCVGLMTSVSFANRIAAEGDLTTTATLLAQAEIDHLVADKMYRGYDYITGANYPTQALAAPFQAYQRTIAITEVNPARLNEALANSGLKRVVIAVGWGQQAGQQVQLTTLVSRY